MSAGPIAASSGIINDKIISDSPDAKVVCTEPIPMLVNSESNRFTVTSVAIDFVEDFKLNLYSTEIFVFTPAGELKSLSKGSTALDFAFSVHTGLGLKTRGVKVNGKMVPLSHVLNSGDQIEIIKSENTKPSSNWLDYVKTSRAKSKIRTALKEEKKLLAEDGKEILRRKLKQLKIQKYF